MGISETIHCFFVCATLLGVLHILSRNDNSKGDALCEDDEDVFIKEEKGKMTFNDVMDLIEQ